MNRWKNRGIGRMHVVCAVLGCGGSGGEWGTAAGQDYGTGPSTYYLHRGSSYQHGCWGDCDCLLTAREPMYGTFTLTLGGIGSVTDFYTVTGVEWSVPQLGGQPFGGSIAGAGRFSAGQEGVADHQFMSLELTVTPPPFGGANIQTFESVFGSRTVPPPVISIEIANSTTGCAGVRTQIVASKLRSDWNASGASSVQDLFDFLADYFQSRGDYTGDGETTVGDLFSFLRDWFAGV